MNLLEKFNAAKANHPNLSEHMDTLVRYGHECQHITEFGSGVMDGSTIAFLMARPRKLVSVDLVSPDIVHETEVLATVMGIDFVFVNANDLDLELEETDLLFIDSLHDYEHLKSQLEKYSCWVRKFIIIHDTEVHAERGQTEGHNGLRPAIDEFLNQNHDWNPHEKFTNCFGLQVLKRNG